MDIQSLYYFAEVAKDLHITKTANRLYISQQTLSNHIQRLEEYYNTPLLIRKPALALTPAGEHVLAFAETLGYEERNLKDILSDIEGQTRGVIHFGASTFRMNASIPNILPKFAAEYPGVEIRLSDNFSAALEPQVESGELDFAIVVNKEQRNRLLYTPLMDDQILMCVDDSLLEKYYGIEAENMKLAAMKGTNLKTFGRLPVCIQNNSLGSRIRECFESVGTTPNVYIQCQYNNLSTMLGMRGVCASFTTQMDLASRITLLPDTLNVFPVLYRGKPIYQNLFLVQNRNRYLAKYAIRFQELLIERFQTLADRDVME